MLHTENEEIRELLFKGNIGLEKESLRINQQGFFAHTKNPFPGDKHIVRDFCENQTEINTPVCRSVKEAIETLEKYNRRIKETLGGLEEPELLWPFSNPPYIRSEEDIPVAQFDGDLVSKTAYRNYLSARYGRYKMTFSGIHFNYSFAEELLEADFKLSGEGDFQAYKDQLYVELAEQAAAYGWLLVAITAASPLMDISFVEKKHWGKDLFNGFASVRCSEMGYWNFFTPVFDYTNIRAYADSIQHYVDEGLIGYTSELYYPIRLKSRGENSLPRLKAEGADHIELRMIDLNPLAYAGVEEKDLFFAQLLLIWLAGSRHEHLDHKKQVEAAQNFKNAARYDLKTVNLISSHGCLYTIADAAVKIIERMQEFYQDYPGQVQETLTFQKEKFLDAENRYAWKIRKLFSDGFVEKGLSYIKENRV